MFSTTDNEGLVMDLLKKYGLLALAALGALVILLVILKHILFFIGLAIIAFVALVVVNRVTAPKKNKTRR